MKLRPYLREMNLWDSRVMFRKNCQILQCVKMNQKSNKRYKSEGYNCNDCLALKPPVVHLDDQEALLTCLGNSDLKLFRDLSDPKDEVSYYRDIIKRRTHRYGG